jgi:putative hemin transport protein
MACHLDAVDETGMQMAAAGWRIQTHDAPDLPHKVRLSPRWSELVSEFQTLGEVKASTSGAHSATDASGIFGGFRINGAKEAKIARSMPGPGIDVRYFFQHWASGFAVEDANAADGFHRSLQFFDAAGVLLHTVSLSDRACGASYHALVKRFAADLPCERDEDALAQLSRPATIRRHLDVQAFCREWIGMRETCEFHDLLSRHGLSRLDALKLAPLNYAERIHVACVHEILSLSSQVGMQIRVLAGNRGAIQIYTGALQHIAVADAWISAEDRRFCLQLREDQIGSAWLVRKPTSAGLVHSIELFDNAAAPIAMLFGKAASGRPEPCEWRHLLSNLLTDFKTCVE